jgi:outer membrane receptor protein involved in Fe transport
MKFNALIGTSVLAITVATPAAAQNADSGAGYGDEIVVTAQRQSERLQDVPISVSAFSADALEKQQIVNPSALQQTLPNVTFTKTNFTSSSFTIRGIGDLCVGTTCDSATAIHVNDMPLLGTRLFESEFFDLERVEVLRGPQGTLFGRNATSGVVNFITAKPDLSGFHAAAEFEYGNYDSKRAKAMVNVPLGSTLGVRVAGTWLNRDGYTKNLYNNSRIDDRDLYAVRGSLSWAPTDDTRIDLVGYYFREKDNRSRIQKQLCHRDTTGVLGCLPDKLAYETLNGNATLATILTSSEFLGIAAPGLAGLALNSVFQTNDAFSGAVNPTDVRTVNIDAQPTYFTEEQQYTLKLSHNFGPVSLNLTGGYMKNSVDSTSDYNLAVGNGYATNPGLLALYAGAGPGGPLEPLLGKMRNALVPNGTTSICQSQADPNGVGVYGGNAICAPTSLDFDRSRIDLRQYTVEAHIDSSFDGMFNFLLGGIYFDSKATNDDYFVNSFGLDYASGLLGSASAAAGGAQSFAGTPFYDSHSDQFRLKSYGIFGETYFEFNDRLKLTLGLRYNHDQKSISARTTYLQDTKSRVMLNSSGQPLLDREGNQLITTTGASDLILIPIGASDANSYLNGAAYDFDSSRAGNQPFAFNSVSFGKLTGRAVIDYKITDDNLIYASYSRGYKSGGINPPLSPIFEVPTSFAPEKVDAFEIGSKNSFGNGQLRLNLTGFYYKYKGLQLSRIVARTSVNDNINADIYGIEAEAVISPIRAFVVNANFSYLKSKVSDDRYLANPRDPSGGRSDAVIIKDLFNASNCAIRPAAGSNATAADVNQFVTIVNGALGLSQPQPKPIEGTSTTGAFSVCSVLAAAAAGSVGSFNPAFAGLQGPLQAVFNGGAPGTLPFVVDSSGVPVNVRGNRLPNAPTYKWAVGAQYTISAGDWSIVPRADLNYTGGSWGTIFNKNPIDRIKGYAVINAQIQVNAPDDRFYVRGFVQNLGNTNATTGMYVTDQSSGLFTNIFTVEPRRYGVAAGMKF